MGNFKMRLLFYFIILMIISCGQNRIKVIADRYTNGKVKTIRYFNSKKDSKEKIVVKNVNGIGTADKPLTFLQEGYYKNGKMQYKGQYINGQTSGLWEYFYETGINEAKSYYHNGEIIDTVHCWYPSGNLKRLMIETDSIRRYWHSVDYFENGKKKIECYTYLDLNNKEIIDSFFKEWHDNGALKSDFKFKDGWSYGKYKEWDQNGQLINDSDKKIHIIKD